MRPSVVLASLSALLACGAAATAPPASPTYDRFLSAKWSYHFQGSASEGLDSVQGAVRLDVARAPAESLIASSASGTNVIGFFWTASPDTTRGLGLIWPGNRVQRGRLVGGRLVGADVDSWLNHPAAVFLRPHPDTLVYVLGVQDASGTLSLTVIFVKS